MGYTTPPYAGEPQKRTKILNGLNTAWVALCVTITTVLTIANYFS